ncbi:hypothetical protein GCM10029976_004480 [Kribbella albertanoniae]
MLEQMVKEAVSHIPVPRDGRDYDPDVLQKAVNDAVAKYRYRQTVKVSLRMMCIRCLNRW